MVIAVALMVVSVVDSHGCWWARWAHGVFVGVRRERGREVGWGGMITFGCLVFGLMTYRVMNFQTRFEMEVAPIGLAGRMNKGDTCCTLWIGLSCENLFILM